MSLGFIYDHNERLFNFDDNIRIVSCNNYAIDNVVRRNGTPDDSNACHCAWPGSN